MMGGIGKWRETGWMAGCSMGQGSSSAAHRQLIGALSEQAAAAAA